MKVPDGRHKGETAAHLRQDLGRAVLPQVSVVRDELELTVEDRLVGHRHENEGFIGRHRRVARRNFEMPHQNPSGDGGGGIGREADARHRLRINDSRTHERRPSGEVLLVLDEQRRRKVSQRRLLPLADDPVAAADQGVCHERRVKAGETSEPAKTPEAPEPAETPEPAEAPKTPEPAETPKTPKTAKAPFCR